jgi:DNA-binding GntR family transcriptional regulator
VVSRLDPEEYVELQPAALILECAGVEHAPPYDGAALTLLRAANAQLRCAGDPAVAAAADDAFHERLVERCGNPRLLAVLEPLRKRLEPYKRVYLAEPTRVARRAARHEAIIGALERRDHRTAARRLRENQSAALIELLAQLEGRPACA